MTFFLRYSMIFYMSMKCCGYYTCNHLHWPILLQVKTTSIFILEKMRIYRTEEMDPRNLIIFMK